MFRQFRSTEYEVVCEGVFVSKLDMTLAEFCHACKAYCLERHNQSTCQECAHMIIAAGIVQRETICSQHKETEMASSVACLNMYLFAHCYQ